MLSIQNRTRTKLLALPFEKILRAVLGPSYDLSLVFVGTSRSRSLNKKYRKKDYPANILSFPYSMLDGEIFISPKKVAVEARREGEPYRRYLTYLFIHGLLHLKGMKHGSTMESKERFFLQKFS